MSAPVRIDAHHHVWDLGVRDQPWTVELPALRRSFSFDELRPSLHRHAIDASVLVQTVCVPEETPELLELAAAEPLIAGVVGWLELTAADVAQALTRLRAGPGGELLVGVRHQVQEEPDLGFLARADVRRGLQAVSEGDLAYDLLVRPHQLDAALELAASMPELRFVLDHAGKPDLSQTPLPAWTQAMERLAELPNVAVKLSGLTSEAPRDWTVEMLRPFADVLFSSFGPGRLMFGSDWPVCLLGGGFDATIAAAESLTAGFDTDQLGLLFGGTAASFYRLAI